MNKGVSLHIGVNKLQVAVYQSEAPLNSPVNDANIMASIAKFEGYEIIKVLVNEEASKLNFLKHFDECIALLNEGDTFLLTFSGHGGQIRDIDGDEPDGMDEVWCLYDQPLSDDELGKKWKAFKKNINVIVISASCHSRTALRVWTDECFEEKECKNEIIQNGKSIIESYFSDPEVKASILHISACEDYQEARDGDNLSRFTDLLFKHWNSGSFKGTYEDLVSNIRREAGYTQRSGIATLGVNNPSLLASQPFKLLTNKT